MSGSASHAGAGKKIAGSAGKKITEKLSDEALREATGKGWEEWFALLDAWGGTSRNHTEIARHVREDHGVDGWYAQSVAVGYEQERGLREVGQSSTGEWRTSGSKTIDATAARVIEAFTDDGLRARWLPDVDFTVRTHRPAKSVTADFKDADGGGAGRISVTLTVKAPGKTVVGVGHEKLRDAAEVAAYKSFWKDRLAALKSLLEQGS
ncbi:hypothetical protein OG453_12075 [Streptomyces sp. NBC_01381]|uniref:hypothetical protein n=1 Tax=Streptomyces sp. NBC_01381 TaxID=2903845 RepID=UPI00224DB27D|nr:hypothetical protein [Streptomyces sp. NBC_01381]MCX4667392.1 hypothetical protein [Streptomyces sp. NBC_01381]